MATLTITIPDAAVTRIRAAFGSGTTPATVQEVQLQIRDYIKSRVLDYEISSARDAAVEKAKAEGAW